MFKFVQHKFFFKRCAKSWTLQWIWLEKWGEVVRGSNHPFFAQKVLSAKIYGFWKQIFCLKWSIFNSLHVTRVKKSDIISNSKVCNSHQILTSHNVCPCDMVHTLLVRTNIKLKATWAIGSIRKILQLEFALAFLLTWGKMSLWWKH